MAYFNSRNSNSHDNWKWQYQPIKVVLCVQNAVRVAGEVWITEYLPQEKQQICRSGEVENVYQLSRKDFKRKQKMARTGRVSVV